MEETAFVTPKIPKVKAKRKLAMEASEEVAVRGISKPVYLKEALGELRKTEEVRRELLRSLKLEGELRPTILVEQNPGSAGVENIMQAQHNSDSSKDFFEQTLQIEEA